MGTQASVAAIRVVTLPISLCGTIFDNEDFVAMVPIRVNNPKPIATMNMTSFVEMPRNRLATNTELIPTIPTTGSDTRNLCTRTGIRTTMDNTCREVWTEFIMDIV